MIARRGGRKRVLELGTAGDVFYVARLRVTERQRIRNLGVPERWARPRHGRRRDDEEQSAGKPRTPLRAGGLPGGWGGATDDALLRGGAQSRGTNSEIARIAGCLTPLGAAGSSSATPWTELRAMTLPSPPTSGRSHHDVWRQQGLRSRRCREISALTVPAPRLPCQPKGEPAPLGPDLGAKSDPTSASGYQWPARHQFAQFQGPHERAISSLAGESPARRGRPGAGRELAIERDPNSPVSLARGDARSQSCPDHNTENVGAASNEPGGLGAPEGAGS